MLKISGMIMLLAASTFMRSSLAATVEVGPPFGALPLLDEVRCGEAPGERPFSDGPQGVSKVETLCGAPCRTLPIAPESRFFSYLLGKGKNLKARQAYMLEVEYPEDKPRAFIIINRGGETMRGIQSGSTVGEMLYSYVEPCAESLHIPLSNKMRTFRMFFFLHDRYTGVLSPRQDSVRSMKPEDGFHVLIAQTTKENDPLNEGAAVANIRLYEVLDAEKLCQTPKLPPKDLPHRYLFVREEMGDGPVSSRKSPERGFDDPVGYFDLKMQTYSFLGINTLTRDLLEFGHNQGWDSSVHGGNDWYYQAWDPKVWEHMLALAKQRNLEVLPYYEYCGSIGAHGLGTQKRAQTLNGGKTYTHVTWTENSYCDVTDPDFQEDARKLLDATITRFKDQNQFVGAWFRTRPSQIPMSFSDRALGLFSKEAKNGEAVTRDQLKSDKALYNQYFEWWLGKRQKFFTGLRDYLREKVGPQAMLFFTPYAGEPGPALVQGGQRIITDDIAAWDAVKASEKKHAKMTPVKFDEVVAQNQYAEGLRALHGTWGNWEWQHALPRADPERYTQTPGLLMPYPFSQAFTASSPKVLDGFRGPDGLAMVRHFNLNEGFLSNKEVGYVAVDFDRPGTYCMLSEARAMANGNPRYLGYLAASSFNRGEPAIVRAFNAAFLALPALPAERVSDACVVPEIVVNRIKTEGHGTYYAVINTGLTEQRSVKIKLPGVLSDATNDKALETPEGEWTVDLQPCEMRSLLAK